MNDISNIHLSTIVRRASRFRPDRFTLLLAAIAALGAVLILFRVANGVGVMGDGKYYLHVARELSSGRGWLLESDIFSAYWPPGYPTLLALASGFTFDPRGIAGVLNAAAFGTTVFIAGHWLRHRIQSRFLAVLGALGVLVSVPIVWVGSYAFSEVTFILPTMLALFQGDKYLQSGKRSSLIWAGVFTALAFLTRYAGVAVIMALVPLFILQRKEDLSEKARHVGLYIIISITPTFLYVLRHFLVLDTLTGPREPSNYSVPFNAQRALDTITGWNSLGMDYFPSIMRTPEATFVALLALASLVMYSIMRWVLKSNDTHENSFLPVVGSFTFVYLTFMVVSATMFSFGSSFLDSRLLSPMYIPLVLAFVSAIDKIPKYWGELTQVSGLSSVPALQNIRKRGIGSVLWPTLSAGILLLCVGYAGYVTARDAWIGFTNPEYGWNAYTWKAENIEVHASSVDEYLRNHVGDAEPIVRSQFNIYFHDNTLTYVRETCSNEETGPRFFLHVTPVNRVDLPGIRKQYGNENFDFYFEKQGGVLLNGKCLAVVPIPEYDIEYISTGQHGLDNTSRNWQVNFKLDE